MDKTKLENRIKELEIQINSDMNTLNNWNNQIEQLKQKILQEQGAILELKRILSTEKTNNEEIKNKNTIKEDKK